MRMKRDWSLVESTPLTAGTADHVGRMAQAGRLSRDEFEAYAKTKAAPAVVAAALAGYDAAAGIGHGKTRIMRMSRPGR